jgi:hypothetical protein
MSPQAEVDSYEVRKHVWHSMGPGHPVHLFSESYAASLYKTLWSTSFGPPSTEFLLYSNFNRPVVHNIVMHYRTEVDIQLSSNWP